MPKLCCTSDDTFARLTYTTDLSKAVAMPTSSANPCPSLVLKESFWREVSKHAAERTVFTTNSSTLVPSVLACFVDGPQKFLALHFAIAGVGLEHRRVMNQPVPGHVAAPQSHLEGR